MWSINGFSVLVVNRPRLERRTSTAMLMKDKDYIRTNPDVQSQSMCELCFSVHNLADNWFRTLHANLGMADMQSEETFK